MFMRAKLRSFKVSAAAPPRVRLSVARCSAMTTAGAVWSMDHLGFITSECLSSRMPTPTYPVDRLTLMSHATAQDAECNPAELQAGQSVPRGRSRWHGRGPNLWWDVPFPFLSCDQSNMTLWALPPFGGCSISARCIVRYGSQIGQDWLGLDG